MNESLWQTLPLLILQHAFMFIVLLLKIKRAFADSQLARSVDYTHLMNS